MARWWLATLNDDGNGGQEVQYEPWDTKPSKNAIPHGEPWAIYTKDFYVSSCSPDWGQHMDDGSPSDNETAGEMTVRLGGRIISSHGVPHIAMTVEEQKPIIAWLAQEDA
jgi:hypothetical protein